jgi:arsenite-transporting ATPase
MANLGQALAAFDITEAARDVGGQAAADFVDKLGLKDFAKLLETPPPGIDEIVALSDVLKFARGSESGGDQIPKFVFFCLF